MKISALFYAGLSAIVFLFTGSAYGWESTALDRYVAAPDATYHYQLLNSVGGNGYTGYVLEMTSQRWHTAEEVDQPIWRHWLTVVRPEHLETGGDLAKVGLGVKPRIIRVEFEPFDRPVLDLLGRPVPCGLSNFRLFHATNNL